MYRHVLMEKNDSGIEITVRPCTLHPVSYTHLDVYKRQVQTCGHGIQQGYALAIRMHQIQAEGGIAKRRILLHPLAVLIHRCLLYTSRCV